MPDAVKTPQQVHGGIPVQPWFERAFAQQGVDDVPGAGGAARFGPRSISGHLIEILEASAKLRVRLSGWAAARGSWRSRGPGPCQILKQKSTCGTRVPQVLLENHAGRVSMAPAGAFPSPVRRQRLARR